MMKTLYVTVEQDSSIGLIYLQDAISNTPKDRFVRSENQLPLQHGICYFFSKLKKTLKKLGPSPKNP